MLEPTQQRKDHFETFMDCARTIPCIGNNVGNDSIYSVKVYNSNSDSIKFYLMVAD